MLIPCARETVDFLVVKGTFPPFMLAPVNLDALYPITGAARPVPRHREINERPARVMF